jgi:hypothetical protein
MKSVFSLMFSLLIAAPAFADVPARVVLQVGQRQMVQISKDKTVLVTCADGDFLLKNGASAVVLNEGSNLSFRYDDGVNQDGYAGSEIYCQARK